MMSLRLELSRGAALQATTLKAFVPGPGVTWFPRWRTPSIVQGDQPYVITKGSLAT